CIPRPSGATPFPYTTLFRSRPGDQVVPVREERVGGEHLAQQHEGDRGEPQPLRDAEPLGDRYGVSWQRGDTGHAGAPPPKASRVDRKSTRLNSSHDQISYAV